MKELSIFIDESGDIGTKSLYYIVSLVFHDQADDLADTIRQHELTFKQDGMADIPFHMTPLMRAHEPYAALSIEQRKRYLAKFAAFAQHVPFKYHTFSYEKKLYATQEALFTRMKKDLIIFIYENIAFFQRNDIVKVYYDNGQRIVTRAVHGAFSYALNESSVVYRDATPQQYRLFQLADYLCGIELTRLHYSTSTQTGTDGIFFGNWGNFKKNYLKKVQKHLL